MVKQKQGPPPRTQTTIDIDDDAQQRLEDYLRPRGERGVKKFVLSKLVKWFVRQEDSFKSALIGWVDEDMKPHYAKVFRAMADQLDPSFGAILHDPTATGSTELENIHLHEPPANGAEKERPRGRAGEPSSERKKRH
jgi:hypothetical protein